MTTKNPKPYKASKELTLEQKHNLSNQEAKFAQAYLYSMNATKAAITAGYSVHTANSISTELLARKSVQDYLIAIKQDRNTKTLVNADWLLLRLAQECNADLADLFDDNNCIKDVRQWPQAFRQGLVVSMDVDEIKNKDGEHIGYAKKIKFDSRTKRLEMIGKHVDVQGFEDRKKVDVNVHDASTDDLRAKLIEMLQRGQEKEVEGDFVIIESKHAQLDASEA